MINCFIFIVFAFLPSLFWLLVARFIDRKNPEPKKEIIRIFLWGCFAVLPAFLLVKGAEFFINKVELSSFFYIIISSFLVNGLIEELTKYFVLRQKIYHHPVFDEPLDGLVYGVTCAMGFVFVENIFYLFFSSPEIILVRFPAPNLMHALATGFVGYSLALAKFKKVSSFKKKLYIIVGIITAILFHGLYNSIVIYNVFFAFVPMAVLIILSYFFLLRELNKIRKIKKAD